MRRRLKISAHPPKIPRNRYSRWGRPPHRPGDRRASTASRTSAANAARSLRRRETLAACSLACPATHWTLRGAISARPFLPRRRARRGISRRCVTARTRPRGLRPIAKIRRRRLSRPVRALAVFFFLYLSFSIAAERPVGEAFREFAQHGLEGVNARGGVRILDGGARLAVGEVSLFSFELREELE